MNKIQIKDSFVLRKICGYNIIIPIGKNIKDFNGALILNETSTIIYKQLQQGKSIEEIADILISEYDVTTAKAIEDTKKTIELLKDAGILDENQYPVS